MKTLGTLVYRMLVVAIGVAVLLYIDDIHSMLILMEESQ